MVPLKSGLKVTSVIENGTIRKFRYGFLFVFQSNYGRVFSHFDTIHERDRHPATQQDDRNRRYAALFGWRRAAKMH